MASNRLENRMQLNKIIVTKTFLRTQIEYQPTVPSKVKISHESPNPESSGLGTHRGHFFFFKKLKIANFFLKAEKKKKNTKAMENLEDYF